MFEFHTTPIAVELKANPHAVKDDGSRRTAILPAMKFVKNEIEYEITEEILQEMAANLRSGKLGPRRMVTLAHPQNEKLLEAKAVGWMLSDTAQVSKYGDTVALYADIDWTKKMERSIENKEYGFISPVFQNHYADPYSGDDLGWTLRFAGVTNDPHWTGQNELWNQFSAALNNSTEVIEMKELEAKIEEIAALKLEAEGMAAKIAELESKLSEGETKAAEFSAAQTKADDRIKELEGQNAEMHKQLEDQAFDTMIAEMTAAGTLQKKHTENEKLMELARKEPAEFKLLIESFGTAQPPKDNVGGASDRDPNEGKTANEIAVQLGRDYIAKNPGVKYHEIAGKCMQAAQAGKTELTL